MSEEIPKVEAPALVVAPPASVHDTAENLASTTTPEQDRMTKGQRKINDVWEYTQAAIALLVVMTTCVGIFIGRVLLGSDVTTVPFPPEWWTILGLVIGFYFGRTNHARMGE